MKEDYEIKLKVEVSLMHTDDRDTAIQTITQDKYEETIIISIPPHMCTIAEAFDRGATMIQVVVSGTGIVYKNIDGGS